MIYNFPKPYPNELWYSVLARFGETSYFGTERKFHTFLFENSHRQASRFSAQNLTGLSQRVFWMNEDSPSRIIFDHTLFNYQTALKPPEFQKVMFECCLGSKPLRTAVGTLSNLERYAPHCLKFCLKCWEEDEQLLGDCYWRVDHQPVTSLLCLKHQAALHMYPFMGPSQCRHSYVPISANYAFSHLDKTQEDHISEKNYEYAQKLSNWSLEFLRTRDLCINKAALHLTYQKFFAQMGFASNSGKLRTAKIIQVLKSRKELEPLFSAISSNTTVPFTTGSFRDLGKRTTHIQLMLLSLMDVPLNEFISVIRNPNQQLLDLSEPNLTLSKVIEKCPRARCNGKSSMLKKTHHFPFITFHQQCGLCGVKFTARVNKSQPQGPPVFLIRSFGKDLAAEIRDAVRIKRWTRKETAKIMGVSLLSVQHCLKKPRKKTVEEEAAFVRELTKRLKICFNNHQYANRSELRNRETYLYIKIKKHCPHVIDQFLPEKKRFRFRDQLFLSIADLDSFTFRTLSDIYEKWKSEGCPWPRVTVRMLLALNLVPRAWLSKSNRRDFELSNPLIHQLLKYDKTRSIFINFANVL